MSKVDVAISVYGKPFHTAVTLASLFQHCGEHIGRVYFQEELAQPHGDQVRAVAGCFPGRTIQHYKAKYHLSYDATPKASLAETDLRQSVRYQLAWESTDKDYLFITHNDCLYTADVVGGMLERLRDQRFTGVGLVGQCWNCPAHYAKLCHGDVYESFRPSYDEAIRLVEAHPSPRTHAARIDPASPMPLPECRLNEFACMVNLPACRSLVMPLGDVMPIGAMGVDIGTDWFRQLTLRGHRFLNWFEGLRHAPFSANGNGITADGDRTVYEATEARAAEYLAAHHRQVFDSLTTALRIAA